MFSKYVVFLVISIFKCVEPIEPISTSIGIAFLGALYNHNIVKEYTYCRFTECCTSKYILNDLHSLANEFDYNVFGQHLVRNTLIAALTDHFQRSPSKPLVFSFHGPTGTGKNFVSNIVINHLYKNGERSKYVHKFSLKDFTDKDDLKIYQAKIQEIVKQSVALCNQSLFVFDEVEKFPAGLFDSLTSYLEHSENVDGVDYRQAIFIFLSNYMDLEVANQLTQLMENGQIRENIPLYQFENHLLLGSYNLEGGLKKSFLIDSSLIDHYIPFLPMERRHIIMCIESEFQRGYGIKPTNEQIKFVEKSAITYDGLFSNTGCKRISSKVPLAIN